ncbi:sulfate transporter family-domain-containing protein [Entophlyctis helioformis]|nr:sulfate transporter family-domain-containing protein [Entophlyctis helioformis]
MRQGEYGLVALKSVPAVCLAVILNLLDAMSYGIIIFPASDQRVPATAAQSGISMFLTSTIISQIVLTFGGSQFRGAVGSMMIEVMPFLHIICATIEAKMPDADTHTVTATIMVAYAMSTIMTGLVFMALGVFKLGSLIQFFPRHILVGCIGGIGLFLLFTGIEVTAGVKPGMALTYLWDIFQPSALKLWGSSLAVALVLKTIQRHISHPLLVPVFYATVPAIFYAIVLPLGLSIDSLRQYGWLFDLPASADTPFWTFWTYIDMGVVNWSAVAATIPTQMALSFFGILHVPINVPALAVSTKQDVDLSREIIGHGISNILAGLAATPQNYLVYSNSLLYIRSGGDSQISGALLTLATVLLWIKGSTVIGYVPTIVVGSLIFHLGIDLITESVIDTYYVGIHPLEYATILVIVAVMGVIGFTEGVMVGIMLACVFFVVIYARRSIIRDSFSGTQLRSTVHRLYRQQIFLDNCGDQIHVIKLQGFMFFGTVGQVEAHIQNAFAARPDIKYIVLDFGLISGIDYSALESFQRIKRILASRQAHLVFCSLGALQDNLVKAGVFDIQRGHADMESPDGDRRLHASFVNNFETLDGALEYCENCLLETFYAKTGSRLKEPRSAPIPAVTVAAVTAGSGADTLAVPGLTLDMQTPRQQHAQDVASLILKEHPPIPRSHRDVARPMSVLMQAFSEVSEFQSVLADLCGTHFELVHVLQGETLFSVGDASTELYVVEEGEVVLAIPDGRSGERVVETLLAGTMVGELEMFADRPRACRLYATRDTMLWRLDKTVFDELCAEHPALMLQFVTKVALAFDAVRYYNTLRHWAQLR